MGGQSRSDRDHAVEPRSESILVCADRTMGHVPLGRSEPGKGCKRQPQHHGSARGANPQFHRSQTLDPKSRAGGFFECPDLFELAIDGNPARKKWVLTAARSAYRVGTFDGAVFLPETPLLTGQLGKDGDFYAAQTYSDIPADDGRRIQIGWLRAPSPAMAFNQTMSLPLELRLVSTPGGPRLTRQPAKELQSLRKSTRHLGPLTLGPGSRNPLGEIQGELVEFRADFDPGTSDQVVFAIRGVPVLYDARRQEIVVNGVRAPAPLKHGHQRLALYLDRTTIEVFAADGLTYVPVPVIAESTNHTLELSVKGGSATFAALQVYELNSIWP